MNSNLDMPFSNDKIRRALFDLNPNTAPGPDGFMALFFQEAWSTVGNDLTDTILKILNEGASLEDWNATVLILIPKVKEPSSMKDFRPIGLCNVCYKIIAFAITNRLKEVMGHIIDLFQSAFIPRRAITDNIIIGYECMNWLRNSNNKQGYAALKLDMSKAYDRVECHFLQSVLKAMGFSSNWISTIMKCVTSVSLR